VEKFLELVAQDLYDKLGEKLSSAHVIFPSRRAHLHFNYYLSRLIQKPLWTPRYASIEDFFRELSSLHPADTLLLNYLLYKEYKKIIHSEESFSSFYSFGTILLADFDNVDKYLVNPDQLYTNLKDLKEIEKNFDYLTPEQREALSSYWNTFTKIKTDKQHHLFFLQLWENLADIYHSFKDTLRKDGIAYSGMMARDIIEKIKNNHPPAFPSEKYIFIGFNALTRCEEELFLFLHQQKKALFYWDYDEYYLSHPHHEAGYFLKTYIKKFPNQLKEDHYKNFSVSQKNIHVYAIPSVTGQAKILSSLLPPLLQPETERWDKTVIVLPDEQLLLPVLYSLPEEIQNVNITMGYPVRFSATAGLIKLYLELYRHACKKTEDRNVFYYKYVCDILSHPLVKTCTGNDSQEILSSILTENKIYIPAKELHKNDLLTHLFSLPASPPELPGHLMKLCQLLLPADEENSLHDIEKETLYVLYTTLVKFKNLLQKIEETFSADLMIRLVLQLVQPLTLPFEGEPLKGMQIMGLLETRTLDFDNVIILSVNEGILPKNIPPASFIPYNLRKGFGLPTIEHQDAIFAYYFYRLLQRASNIHLTYNCENNKDGLPNEISRYLLQLKYESHLTIQEHPVSYPITFPEKRNIEIQKTETIRQILKKYYGEGNDALSPSAISHYLMCPLRFYFHHIAGLKEAEEIEEEADDLILGIIFHGAMEKLYRHFINKELPNNDLKTLLKNKQLIPQTVRNQFAEYFKHHNGKTSSDQIFLQGKNLIVYNVVCKYIKKVIEEDLTNHSSFTLQAVEKECNATFKVNELNIRLTGKMDRIDCLEDGTIRIIDYKTGISKEKKESIEKLFNEKINHHWIQMLIYTLMWKEKHPGQTIYPCLYYLRNNTVQEVPFWEEEELKKFSEQLSLFIEEMFNPEIPFRQTADPDQCSICPYQTICDR